MQIMVVDDHQDTRSLLRDALEAEGHTVHEATDGRMAIDRLMVYRPDLIITDILMPEIEGIEFILRLRQSGIPMIAISGLPRERVVNELLASLGIAGIVQKPFSIATIRTLVDSAVGRGAAAA